MYNSEEKHRLSIMDLLSDIKEIKKTEYHLSFNSGNKRKIYQNKFLANNKWWGGGGGSWDCIYIYIRLCPLGFGVTLLIFKNSKKNSPKIKIN